MNATNRIPCQNIHFIGAQDDNLDLFEGQYPVPHGISYNSYFINDSRKAVVDAVDIRRCSDWLTALGKVLADGKKPDYLIVQHAEPDHSGSIKEFISLYPEAEIVCTAKCAEMLANFFEDIDFQSRIHIVGDTETLILGETVLRFITAPMVHWPEVMMTLDTTHGILFSADAFGSFAMTDDPEAWDAEARRYYTNIVGRFGQSVQTVMKKIAPLKFSAIAPLHGPVLTENLEHYWKAYDRWSRYQPDAEGVLVAYASIYGGTALAARRLAAALEAEGAGEVVLLDLCRHDVSYAVAEAFRLSRLALCSVTYDADIMPAMHNFLHHLQRKNFRNRPVGLIENGSWAPQAARIMTDMLSKMKDMTVVEPIVTLRSRLHTANLESIQALACALAQIR